MNAPSDLPSLYRTHPILLWVEDVETKIYLQTIWQDAEIGCLVAGGHENIRAIVQSARKAGFVHVFGFCDRDFGTTNRPSWDTANDGIFRSEAFELENLLLDGKAMEACSVHSAKLSAQQIEDRLRALASKLPYWMSCRSTLAKIRSAVTDQFPEHPKRDNIKDAGTAAAAIFESEWWKTVRPSSHDILTEGQVRTWLQEAEARYLAQLASDEWKTHVSGKEVLTEILTSIWTKQRPKSAKQGFVQSIAEAQLELECIPEEVLELQRVLHRRVTTANPIAS